MARHASRRPVVAAAGICVAAVAAVVGLASAGSQAAGEADGVAFFEQRVRPILAERCYSCHSERAEKLRAGLRLDTKEGLLAGGDGGPVVVPGNPDASRLIVAVRYRDKDLKMPPREKLTPQQIADLEQWVRMGAPDPRVGAASAAVAKPKAVAIDWNEARQWWAYQPPQVHPVPEVKRTDWAQSPIDQFILAKLEAKGLSPAAPADKRTLIRRAYFDLIGLPPTPEEVEAFVKDESPDAFAKVVDKLLASPHYGERWGRHWLDLVRYTDSFDARGVGGDADVPESYRYRDWVIKAFNDDLPYDQFVMNQIAGDLLPAQEPGKFNADGIVATGMYVLGEWGIGDADKEKMLTDIVDDQIDVTGRAFLGLTIACARCHDHKFDPIPTADYYGLAGIFFSSHILPGPGLKTAGSPVMRVELVPPEAKAQRKREEARVRELAAETERVLDEQYAKLAHAVLPDIDRYLVAAWEYQHLSNDKGESKPAPPMEQFAAERKLHPYALRRTMDYLGSPALRLLSDPQRNVQGMAMLNGWRAPGADNPSMLTNASDQPARFLTITMPPKSLAVHPGPRSGVAVAWRAPIDGSFKITGRVMDADPVGGNGVEWAISRVDRLGKKTEIVKGDLGNGATEDFAAGGRAAVLAAISAQKDEMIEVAVGAKGDYSYDTTVVELHLDEIDGKGREWDLTKEVVPDPIEGGNGNPHSDNYGNKDVWHFYDLAGQLLAGQAPEGSALARWLDLVAGDKTKPTDAKAVESAAGLLRDMMVILEGQSDWLQKERTQAFALSGPDVPFYQALTDPRGPFWSAARPDEANLPADAKAQVASMRQEREGLQAKLAEPVPVAHALQEGGTPMSAYAGIKDARVLIRGQYNRPGETVPRHFPQIVAGEKQPTLGKDASGRLELAKWVASPQNPLTARVMVNRIWQHHFGEGLVRTPNNFGKLGVPPTHPELLNWLALRFMEGVPALSERSESKWSVKAMHRAIMLSAAYQQSSRPDPATYAADPENLLVGRMNRQRLDAEALRDSLLSITGALDETVGGKAEKELESPRRTLYVMTVRSDRSNFRSLFDAADPGAVVEKRIETTVAPQALFLLNHPFALDRTKALVQRLLARPLADDRARIDWLYRVLYGRAPTDQEIEIGTGVLERAKKADGNSEASAEQAWEEYCQILLCANEFMFVD